VPARRLYLWAVLACSAPASPAAAQPLPDNVVSAPALSTAAVRIVAPFGFITSTFRTVEHNRAVGGVPDSYHLLGRAIDIVRRPGISHAQIAAALKAAGFHLVESLDEGDHSHFAFGALRAATRRSPEPPPASPQPKNLLAADEHGTLRIDLGSAAVASRSPGVHGRSQRRAIR
jgi:hypothetical protein